MSILIIKTPGINRFVYRRNHEIMKFNCKLVDGDFVKNSGPEITAVKSTYVPKKGDKIYFAPAVSVPRVKFKNICAEHKIKTIRNFSEADLIVTSKKTLDFITNSEWHYRIDTENLKNFYKAYPHLFDEYDLEKLETLLLNYDCESIAVSYSFMDWIHNLAPEYVNDNEFYSQLVRYIEEDYTDFYKHLKNANVIDENSIITILNGEKASVIDNPMYEHLKEMFDSSDQDNHVLAMEIMANSMYKESLVYLELLFYKYSHLMLQISSRNHVNFKSLLSYLDKELRQSTTIDVIMNSLKEKDEFNTKNFDIVLNELSEVILRKGNSQYFLVKQITLNPEVAPLINENYVFETVPDFIPEVIEEEIVEELDTEFASPDNFEFEVTEAESDVIELEPILVKQDLDELKQEMILDEDLAIEDVINNETQTNDRSSIDWF